MAADSFAAFVFAASTSASSQSFCSSCIRSSTFATLAKRIKTPDKDMLELIGHTDISMTRYYQDVDLNDLRKITDAL